MKTISLWQPWATLIAIGAKKIETRSWATSYRGPLAIHATKSRSALSIVWQRPFKETLTAAGYANADQLPLGCIVCIAELVDCMAIASQSWQMTESQREYIEQNGGMLPPLTDEYFFGDYTAGRYGWILTNVQRLPEPIPATGKQGFWEWDIPEGVKLI